MKLKILSVISTLKSLGNENFNSRIDEGEFPFELKHADIAPIHKKERSEWQI